MHDFTYRKSPMDVKIREGIANPIQKIYDLVPGPDGLPVVQCVDEVDVDAKIQAAAALSFDLGELAGRLPGDNVYQKLDAMVSAGIISDPRKNKATITDMTLAPKDKAESVEIARKAKAEAKTHGEEGDRIDYNALFEKVVNDYLEKAKAKQEAAASAATEGGSEK